MTRRRGSRIHERWAQLRFSVVGHLLAARPANGALRSELDKPAAREWRHPTTGELVRFGVSTLERWYHRVGVLRRKVRKDAGAQVAMSETVRQVMLAQRPDCCHLKFVKKRKF